MTDQHPLTDYDKGFDRAASDCWAYLYYELGMKDLADEMDDWVRSRQKSAWEQSEEDN